MFCCSIGLKIQGTKEEVKREKKDKKHNKDKKRKERAGRSREHRHHKRLRKDESANASKKVDDDNEIESLEKSCLTMEPDHQTSSQNSSDSNENEGPNHIQSQPFDGRHNDSGECVCLLVVGSVLLHVLATMMTLFLRIVAMGFEETSIRVLLHGKGQKYPEVMMTDSSHTALCECVGHRYSTSANQAPRDASRVCQEKTRDPVFDSAVDISTKLCKDEETNRQFSMQLGKEKRAASSSLEERIGPSKLCRKCPPSTAMRFWKLIEDWAPDRLETKLNDSEDEELWLLMKVGAKRHHGQASVQTSSKGSSSMVWATTAQFLPEAELHALPFTVPF